MNSGLRKHREGTSPIDVFGGHMTREATHAPGIHRIRVCPESLKAGFAFFLLFTRNLTLATPPPYSAPHFRKSGELGRDWPGFKFRDYSGTSEGGVRESRYALPVDLETAPRPSRSRCQINRERLS